MTGGRGWGTTRRGRAPRLLLTVALLVAGAACASGGDALPAPEPPATTAPLLPAVVDPAVVDGAPAATEAPTTTASPGPAAEADDPALAGSRRGGSPGRGAPAPTGRMEIPAIGLDHPTFEGIGLDVLDHGPSHWPGTAMPGEPGNTVFPGHRVTNTRPFLDIDRLVAGDLVIFTTPAGRFTYKVAETLVVPADAMWIANPTPGPTMTIFGCHPKGSARYRYVARGPLVGSGPVQLARPSPSAPSAPSPAPPPSTTSTTAPPAVGLPCLLCLGGR